jgi:nicotinamidase-related amidase
VLRVISRGPVRRHRGLKPAILVIDVIQDFVYGRFGSERAASILPRLRGLLDHARSRGVPVVYLTDAHLPEGDAEFEIWGEHAVMESEGAEIVDGLKPGEGDFRILKRHYSCFYATGLDALLRELGLDTVVLTGLVTDICVQHTAADAFFRGYKILVPKDCVEAVSDEAQEGSLGYMERMYGAEITSSEELIGELLLGGGR